jgi:hypothetical protein
MRVEMIPG